MIMFGISTEQNTTNLIPAIQCSISKLILLETSMANKKGWSKGLIKILEDRNIVVEIIRLKVDEDTHIPNIIEIIKRAINDIDEPIIWNGGGGQKIQFAALWECFNFRKNTDTLCYTNQNSKDLEFWKFKGLEKVTYQEKINVDLTAYEILGTFGFDVKSGNLIFGCENSLIREKTRDLLHFQEFREYFYNSPFQKGIEPVDNKETLLKDIKQQFQNSKTILKSSLKKIILDFDFFELLKTYHTENGEKLNKEHVDFEEKIDRINNLYLGGNGVLIKTLNGENNLPPVIINNEALKKELETLGIKEIEKFDYGTNFYSKLSSKIDSSAKYFEIILAQYFVDFLSKNNSIIKYVYLNLKTEKEGKEIAEYDILCVTQQGTLIAFDAKTFSFGKKDADARMQNLNRAGGRFVKFIVVFPFNSKDLEIMNKGLRELPFTLINNGIYFYYFGEESEVHHLKKKKGTNEVELCDKDDKDTIKIQPLNVYIYSFKPSG
jgi:hypothetical protein